MTFALATDRLLLRDENLDDIDAFSAYRCKESYWPIEMMPTTAGKGPGPAGR